MVVLLCARNPSHCWLQVVERIVQFATQSDHATPVDKGLDKAITVRPRSIYFLLYMCVLMDAVAESQ